MSLPGQVGDVRGERCQVPVLRWDLCSVRGHWGQWWASLCKPDWSTSMSRTVPRTSSGIQSTLLGALERKIPPSFWMLELVLYGIRLLAHATLWSSRPMNDEPRHSSTNESGEWTSVCNVRLGRWMTGDGCWEQNIPVFVLFANGWNNLINIHHFHSLRKPPIYVQISLL